MWNLTLPSVYSSLSPFLNLHFFKLKQYNLRFQIYLDMNDTELLLETGSISWKSPYFYIIYLKVEFQEMTEICSLASKLRPLVFNRVNHKNKLGLLTQLIHVFKCKENAQVWIRNSFQSWHWLGTDLEPTAKHFIFNSSLIREVGFMSYLLYKRRTIMCTNVSF